MSASSPKSGGFCSRKASTFSQSSGLIAELSGKAMNVLQRVVSLRGVRELSSEDARRLEADWNSVFTRIGLMQGQLKARRKELLGRSILAQYSRATVWRQEGGALAAGLQNLRLSKPFRPTICSGRCANYCAMHPPMGESANESHTP